MKFPRGWNVSPPLRTVFSTFLVPPPFKTVPYVLATPTVELFSLLRCNCNFDAVMNCKHLMFRRSWAIPVKGSLDSQKGHDPQFASQMSDKIFSS